MMYLSVILRCHFSCIAYVASGDTDPAPFISTSIGGIQLKSLVGPSQKISRLVAAEQFETSF